jgi:hypothetical protein
MFRRNLRVRFAPLLALAAFAVPAQAQQAQGQLDTILHDLKREDIPKLRAVCAMGQAPKHAADARAAGVESPDASAWCVTVLTRLGREGMLSYVRDPRTDQPTPAITFDGGFVGGYLKHDALPAGAPSIATLLPVAERCLEQQEANGRLCSSVGYMLGLRAAQGEVVSLR